jgi:GNAT superfamily N-acetyltransferase
MQASSSLTVRRIRESDVLECGRIGFAAHKSLSDRYGYPPEQPSVDFSIGLIRMKLNDPNAWGAVAESGRDHRVAGSVFLNTFPNCPVAVIGPLTVSPSSEGGVGRGLLLAALEEANGRGFEQVRLVQSPSHPRSLALYSKLGFDLREPLALVGGAPIAARSGDGNSDPRSVRLAGRDDLASCDRLCARIHGFERQFELSQAIRQRVATVVERRGRIVGYAAGVGFIGHAVAETTEDLEALVGSATSFQGPGFFVPLRNGKLLRWLLGAGLKVVWPANLMTLGKYSEPAGAFLPSIAF